jgi:hypothetical protein
MNKTELKKNVRNDLFAIWLEVEFGLAKGDCKVCGGFDPLTPKKVYKLPRGNYCRDHVLKEIAVWINGGVILNLSSELLRVIYDILSHNGSYTEEKVEIISELVRAIDGMEESKK